MIWIILAVVLVLRTLFLVSQPLPKIGTTISFSATVISEPVVKGNVQRFEVIYKNQRIGIWAARFPKYHYADRLTISGKLETNTSKMDSKVLDKFRDDIRLYFPTIEAKKERETPLAFVEKVRQHIIATTARFLPANEAALLAGILLGTKVGFSDEFYDALRNTGTLHVVAASGMNVSILATFAMMILLRVFNRRLSAICVVVTILFYTALALFQPPIVRAALMGIALFIGSMLNRQTQAVWFLALACYIMLLFDPLLLFDLGFQLSFAATSGLLMLLPLFEKNFGWFSLLKKLPILGDGATTTIVAQLATLPILLANFGSISILSVFVNTAIIWTSQPIMFLGIIAAILSFLPILSPIVLLATFPLLVFFEKTVLLFNQEAFVIKLPLPFAAAIGYYCLICATYFMLKGREKALPPRTFK